MPDLRRDRLSLPFRERERAFPAQARSDDPVSRISEDGPGEPDLRVVIPGRPTSWKRTGGGGKRRHTEKGQRIAAQRIRIVVREALPDGWSRRGRFRLLVIAEYAGGLEELEQLGDEHKGAQHEGDSDNLQKLVADALQGEGGVWDDDRQIVDERGIKRYGQPVERTIVAVWRVR